MERPRDYLLRRPWRGIELPPDAVGIPTMLSKTERRLLYALARDYASVDAAIIDAGCFLGGSTAALLAGLRDRPERWTGPPVVSYDLFQVEAYTIAKFFTDNPAVRVGDSFRQEFDRYTGRFGVPHEVREGDIAEIGWTGGAIDVLFLDLLKSWEVNDAVLRDFFPWLRPGRSVIVHQDYGSGWVPWIPITVELMRDSLRAIDSMEWGSHVFLVERDLPSNLIKTGVSGLDFDTKFELIDRALGRPEQNWVRGMIEISRAHLVVERDGVAAGLRELERIGSQYAHEAPVGSAVTYVTEGLATGWMFDSESDQQTEPRRRDRRKPFMRLRSRWGVSRQRSRR